MITIGGWDMKLMLKKLVLSAVVAGTFVAGTVRADVDGIYLEGRQAYRFSGSRSSMTYQCNSEKISNYSDQSSDNLTFVCGVSKKKFTGSSDFKGTTVGVRNIGSIPGLSYVSNVSTTKKGRALSGTQYVTVAVIDSNSRIMSFYSFAKKVKFSGRVAGIRLPAEMKMMKVDAPMSWMGE